MKELTDIKIAAADTGAPGRVMSFVLTKLDKVSPLVSCRRLLQPHLFTMACSN